MYTDLINLGLGFLEGFALIISPCILPILPIILAGSLTGSKKRPLGIVAGFVLVFSLFTFFSRKLVQYSGIDLNLIRHFSYSLLFLLGLIMISNYATEKFTQFGYHLAKVGYKLTDIHKNQEGVVGGLIFGSLVALIWTPCAGPILAAVIVQTVIQKTTAMSFLTILAFALGAAGPMLLIAIFGRKIMVRLHFFKTHTVLFRKILGVIIIATVGYMIYFEGSISVAAAATENKQRPTELQNALANPYPAPALGGITAWINSKPLELSALKGKVVLIDFWTYSCINCIRTLPYLKAWYNNYHNKGLVIIGIHTPEFDFEKDLSNVKTAVLKDGIQYPVALDNDFVTWRNFDNRYWPAHYLIDKSGKVVYIHFGEGEYERTENNIRFLLGLEAAEPTKAREAAVSSKLTPETYLGYARAAQYASPEAAMKDKTGNYSFPLELADDAWALQGKWTIYADKIVSAAKNSVLKIHFQSHKVFMVMGSTTGQPIHLKLLLNGEPLLSEKGRDVTSSSLEVNKHRLYEVVVLDHRGEGILQILPSAPGLEVYTFTFGD